MCAKRTIKQVWISALIAAACLCVPVARAVLAQDAASGYPNRTVRIIVGFTPGGAPDIIGRDSGAKLNGIWKQPVIVENRPGAGSEIAARYVADAAPDGYTLFSITNSSRGGAGGQFAPLVRCGKGFHCDHDDVDRAELGAGFAAAWRQVAEGFRRARQIETEPTQLRLRRRRQLHAIRRRDVRRCGRNSGAARTLQRSA